MPHISAALTRWKGTCGLKQVRKGFSFDKEHDQLFALGWPHMRFLTDETVDGYKMGMTMLRETDFSIDMVLPRQLASGLLRAWEVGELFIIAPGVREIRDEVQSALWNTDPFTQREIKALIHARMTDRSALWSDSRASESMVLYAEALTKTEWVAEAILEALEDMKSDQLWESVPTQSLITYQLGFLLLRLPQATANNIRIRLHDILDSPWGLGRNDGTSSPNTASHLRAIALILGGAEAAEDLTDHDLRWYGHITNGPKTIKMRAMINRSFTRPDARLMFLGGVELLDTRVGKWWENLSPNDQRWFFHQISPIQAPQVVSLMARMALDDTSVNKLAKAWAVTHAAYATPILKVLAEKSVAGAQALLDHIDPA